MEQKQSDNILHTVKYYGSVPRSIPSAAPIRTISQEKPLPGLPCVSQQDGANPVIEIVTVVDGPSGGISLDGLNDRDVINISDTHMIVHSETLTQTIRDVVQFYAGQNLTGMSLVIHEPYACLMHHMTDLEHLIGSGGDRAKLEHIQILLDFLRPRYEQWYIPAMKRSLAPQPTVMFDDLWAVMRPGSLAYVLCNDYKLGCVIAESVLLPPEPSKNLSKRWSIDFWSLRVHWPSDEIGFALGGVFVDHFDGEKPITSLPIHPAEFFDAEDQGKTKQRFIDRGRKVCEILWGESMYMEYDGECMDQTKQSYTGRIVIGGSDNMKEVYPKHDWGFSCYPPSQLMKKDSDVPLSQIELRVNPKTDHPDIFTIDHLFILSPCMSAFKLLSNDWAPITVENIRPLTRNHEDQSPIVDEEKIELIQRIVYFQYSGNASRRLLSQGKGDGFVIHIHGPSGVGKSSMIDLISLRARQPLLVISLGDLGNGAINIQKTLLRWQYICKRLGAMILIDNCDEVMSEKGTPFVNSTVIAFTEALMTFDGVIFLTTNRTEVIDDVFHPLISLTVSLPELDDKTRNLIWLDLEKRLNAEEGIRLHPNATKFLGSSEARVVNWDGHEITRCFKIAIALATKQTVDAKEIEVVVEDGHFKEAMNFVHGSRRYTPGIEKRYITPRWAPPDSVSGTSDQATDLDRAPPHIRHFEEVDENYVEGNSHWANLRAENPTRPSMKPSRRPVNLNSDPDLCEPDLNRVEWDAFRAAGGEELFRKTKFHAIDVLEGEPQIKLRFDNRKWQRRQNTAQKIVASGTTVPDTVSHGGQAPNASEPGKAPLPERIRINSPAVIMAFRDIRGEEILGPFLLFRPFRSLLYYEQEFRDLLNQQETISQERPVPDTQTGDDAEKETERKIVLAGLEQMKCLISFIENELKKKQEYLTSNHCQFVTFADVSMLFNPGEAVISKDYKQVYRVVKVSCTRHRVKDRKEKMSLDFWKDGTEVQLEDNPVFIHCIYLDFDGKMVGPVSRIFMISKFEGEREVTSLPIFPLQHVEEDGLHERLVKRGKAFLKVCGIKHMHYTGLTLKTRDDIDSQVVIDFEEAINRHPHWKPPILSVLEEFPEKVVDPSSISDDDKDLQGFLKAQKSMTKPCIEECCATEFMHYDEYIEDQRKEDYIKSEMKRAFPTRHPVTIVPREFRDIVENNTLTDDEYLIMSYRVFGFVLRSRKWHELDMTNVFEVATLGAGEGFDELVLPPGHGDMVKSMIRQHLRDRNLSLMNRDKADVVRGKGRGLIILLHGVPGVGKTSTAECVADLFRRPLLQITSGDLGTTAREVEDALEQNFSLASRWNSILLIDEADVFLGERTKEDFVRNSLVAVFLRMMEYYAGVLFLTTNRVGVFDEAFTSRIHISLYYPPLDRKSTLQIFQKNWDRIMTRYKEAGRVIDIDTSEITEFAIDYFENNREGRWNGRQIRNAFQSALALAELDSLGTDDFLNETDHNKPVVLGRKSFDTVAEAYKGFTNYLKQVYGADFARRARENLWRFDAFGSPRMPNNLNTRLKVAEPAMPPPPGQWPGQNYAGYDPRNPQPYYPPQQHYAGGYDQSGHGPAYPPSSRPQQFSGPRERWDDRSGTGSSNLRTDS